MAMASLSTNRPNIILIIMDTARAQNFSCYGYERDTTPHIDRIAHEGVLYRYAVSPAEWTVPSHASIFTGTFPSRHGAVNQHRYLDTRFPTLAEILRHQGYHTACFTNNGLVSNVTGLDRGFTVQTGVTRARRQYRRSTKVLRGWERLLSPVRRRDRGAWTLNQLIRWWIRGRSTGSPYFLFVNYVEPHLPHRSIPEPFGSMFLPPGTDFNAAKQINHNYRDYISGRVKMDECDFELLRALYDGDIAYLDHRINQLLTFLGSRGLLDNAMLIITSDHGENLGDHSLMHHAYCLYETLIWVPLIVRYPPTFSPGTVVESVVQTFDLFPTIMDILDLEQEQHIQAHSLLRLDDHPDFAIAELHRPVNDFANHGYSEFDFSPFDRELRAICTGTFKYVWASDGRDELYDIRRDPQEQMNVVNQEVAVAADLRQQLSNWIADHPHEFNTDFIHLTPEQETELLSHLHDLGYTE
jgi:arylsulfatase A-like enzyme